MTKRKILFLFPNTANRPEIPRAITILAGIARSFSWGCDYFDLYCYEKGPDSMQDRVKTGEFKSAGEEIEMKPFSLLTRDLQAKIDSYEPDIIAITCMTFEYEFLVTFWNDIKVKPGTLVIVGGVHAHLMPDEMAKSGFFDIICTGEGEDMFEELVVKYPDKDGMSSIPSTYSINRENGEITRNPRKKLSGGDRLWNYTPDFSFFDDKYFLYPFDGKIYRRFSFETSRGCPFDCTYCGNTALKAIYGGGTNFVRRRPIETMKGAMETLIRDHKIELVYIEDECFLSHPKSWLAEFAEWWGRDVRKPFILQTRPEAVTEEKIGFLKSMNAPFFQVSVGIESGSEKILYEVCNRKTKVEKIVNAFDILRKHGIRTAAFFMLGFPYETREDIFKTIELCRRIRPTIPIVSIFQPLPGQKLRDVCVQEGYITGDERLKTFTGGSILTMPQISQDEIGNLRRTFMLYATLPQEYYPQIERCEKDYENNQGLFEELVKLRWKYAS